ncbi:MAG: alkaline phosphatase family protein, partial [Bacteroidota bacterium]
MKSIHTLLLALISVFLWAQTPKVLQIGIDGCRPDALASANTPNIDQIILNGIYSPDAWNDDITISGPSWSAILTGVTSPKHGVTDNSFNGSNYEEYPALFLRAEQYVPSLNTASIVHWNPINTQIVGNSADFTLNVSTDQQVEDEAVNYLATTDVDWLFLHFDDVDIAGHTVGFSPTVSQYIQQIEEVDAHIGQIMAALTSRPNYANEDWLIIMTPDHGGIGFSHGGTSPEERRMFSVVSGDQVAADTIRRDSTVLPAINCLNEPTELTFDGDDDRVEVPANPAFEFGASRDFTLECRVRTNQAADVNIVGNKDWDSGLFPGYVFSFRFSSGPEWKVNIGDGSSRVDIDTGGEIADGQWHTLSVSFDRDGMMRMYEDGNFVTEADISGIGNINTGFGPWFGTDFELDYDYTGSIAEVRLWEGVLPASSISQWHCTKLSVSHPQYPDLIGYWPLDDAFGNVASDDSGNGYNGSIVGASWEVPQPTVSYDYSQTPRLEDLPVTALTHLCVPIDHSWNLDGESLIPTCTALPVEWLSFEASPKLNHIEIRWRTGREVDNAYFDVERSSDAIDFQAVGRVMHNDQNMATSEYLLSDEAVLPGKTYYYR